MVSYYTYIVYIIRNAEAGTGTTEEIDQAKFIDIGPIMRDSGFKVLA